MMEQGEAEEMLKVEVSRIRSLQEAGGFQELVEGATRKAMGRRCSHHVSNYAALQHNALTYR